MYTNSSLWLTLVGIKPASIHMGVAQCRHYASNVATLVHSAAVFLFTLSCLEITCVSTLKSASHNN